MCLGCTGQAGLKFIAVHLPLPRGVYQQAPTQVLVFGKSKLQNPLPQTAQDLRRRGCEEVRFIDQGCGLV